MPRKPRNPRVVMLERVRTMKRFLSYLATAWDTSGTVYEPTTSTRTVDYGDGRGPQEVTFTNSTTRKRQAHEYPESNPDRLVEAWNVLNDIVVQATWARDDIRRHYETLVPGHTIGTREQ